MTQDSIEAQVRLRTNSPDISRSINGTITSFDSDGFTVLIQAQLMNQGKYVPGVGKQEKLLRHLKLVV